MRSSTDGRRRHVAALARSTGPATAGLVAEERHAAAHGPTVLLVAVCLLALIAGGTLLATGARLFVVESPSMGRAAPVGTLVVGLPLRDGEALRVGQVVTYRPPGPGSSTYTHRIVEVVPGGYRVRGDINGADDPWVVSPTMVATRAVALVPAVGWVLRLAPLLAAGCTGVWALGLLLHDPIRRASTRVLGYSLVLSAALYLYRPLVSYLLLTARSSDGGLVSTVVSTGILPIRIQAIGGRSVDLVSGQVGHLTLPGDAHGHAGFSAAPHLGLLGWCLLAVVCLLPTLWTLLRGVPVQQDRELRDA